ncbi:MAG: RDD family protein [Verrucomicrobia bacterium]|nr:RDD family protein [Verrucomicrobiota bacterium]
MDIWIIRNGEQVGPIHDYEARRRIEARELARDTPAWHEGLDAWRPLGEIPLFKDAFNWVYLDDLETGPSHEEEEQALRGSPRPPPLPTGPVLGRRFWARWLDIHVYIAMWWLVMWASGRNIEAVLNNPWIMVAQLMPWFILESILIHRYGTTPGKWLLGLRVTNTNGTPLSLSAATLRSILILVGGIGFGWSPLALFCQALSFFIAKRLGNPLWDHVGGHRVQASPLAAWRIITVICMFFAALQLQMAVIAPYVLRNAAETFPFLKEELQKNPPWHLPERS